MESADKNEIIIVAVILGVYIAFIAARKVCSTAPESCTGAWAVFGIIFVTAAVFLILKLFR